MALIYVAMTELGAQSRALFPLAANGGLALGMISRHYFTGFGALFLALTVLLACLKTAIGLIVSNAQTFSEMFPNALSYNKWVVLFCCISFGLANLGLSTIIKFSLPILLTLYPLAITLILMVLWEHFSGCSKRAFAIVTAFTAVGAVLDTLCMMPDVSALFHAESLVAFATRVMPMASYNMIWITTAACGALAAALWPKK
jgi:LIVCS family branched-chain amino acid:cation transporter